MVTINDIAKMAGVAKSTVSRYLNGGSVSQKTKDKIDLEQRLIDAHKKIEYLCREIAELRRGEGNA